MMPLPPPGQTIEKFLPLNDAIRTKIDHIIEERQKDIAILRGTTLKNLNHYEAKIYRLTSIAQEMRTNCRKFHKLTFDGKILPDNDEEIIEIAENFISEQISISQKIESVILKYDALLLQVAACETPQEVDDVRIR